MQRRSISALDIILQICIALAIHAVVADQWTWAAVLARIGAAVPLSLLLLASWRVLTERG